MTDLPDSLPERPISDALVHQALIAQYQLQPYRGNAQELRKQAVLFTGSLHNSMRPNTVLLMSDPASQHSFFYQFHSKDILYAEEAPNINMLDGSTVSMVRLWVKKSSRAIKLEPFQVHDSNLTWQDFFEGHGNHTE